MNYIYPWRLHQPFTRRGMRVIAAPTTEQISLADAYQHLRLDGYGSPPSRDDDALLLAMISAAREWSENYCGRALAQQTLELGLDRFPNQFHGGIFPHFEGGLSCAAFIKLPMSPVRGVTLITYLDSTGTLQTMADGSFGLDNYSDPNSVYEVAGTSWPSSNGAPNSIKIRFSAGYDYAGDSPNEFPLPFVARAAMLLMLGHLYENREEVVVATTREAIIEIPSGAKALLDQIRIRDGFA